MPITKNSILSPTKRADLFELMQNQIGYEPNHLQLFEWRTRKLRRNNNNLVFVISKLVCRIETVEHFFEFDNALHKPKWKLRYTTDIPNHTKPHIVGCWEQVVSCFQNWAQDMLVEVKGIERWGAFSPVPLQVPVVPEPTSSITIPEQQQITVEVDSLLLKLQKYFRNISAELREHFHSIFSLLKNWLSQFDRATWLRMFVGVAITIGHQLTVSYLNDEPLWHIFRGALNRIARIFLH